MSATPERTQNIVADERQPLLSGKQTTPTAVDDPSVAFDEENINPGPLPEEDASSSAAKQQLWGPWKITRYVLLTVLVGVGLGLFVKGFMDADDVDVSWVNVSSYGDI